MAMTDEELHEAAQVAKRFIARVEELQKIRGERPTSYTPNFPKEQGAVKRASMDLTRALAQLRKT